MSYHNLTIRIAFAFATAVVASVALTGCFTMMAGAAVTGVFMASDRRTTGAQVDDTGIELRATNRMFGVFGQHAHITATSYNRRVLLTGEVASAEDLHRAGQIARSVDNVISVSNELAVMGSSSLSQRSADALLTGRVKAKLMGAGDLQFNAFKIVTERGTTYMMGRVSRDEGARASALAATTPGVLKVILVLEYLTDEEFARLQPVRQEQVQSPDGAR